MQQVESQLAEFIKDSIHSLSMSPLRLDCKFEIFKIQSEYQDNASQEEYWCGSMDSASPNNNMVIQFSPSTELVHAFPEQAIRERQNRKTFLFLTQSLQQIFPQVNVQRLVSPHQFYQLQYDSAIQIIELILMTSLRDQATINGINVHKIDIQQCIKSVISEICPIDQTRVYTVDPSKNGSNFIDGNDGVWSQNLFFYNCFQGRILTLVLKAVPEYQNESAYDEMIDFEDCDYAYCQKELTEDETYQQFFFG